MKLLSREGGRFVFHLPEQDRETLRMVLRIAAGLDRNPARLSHQPEGAVSADAEAQFAAQMEGVRAHQLSTAAAWLDDPAHCVPGKGGFGLTLLAGEAELLLQAVNGAKIAAWESLGCPELGLGDPPRLKPESLRAVVVSEMADPFLARLLEALDGPD